MQAGITREWVFTAAQTDLSIVTVGAAQRGIVTYVGVTCANSNTGDVHVRLGFAAATLPTVTDNNATGGLGVFFSHPAIAHGGGAVAANGGAIIATGGLDEDIRLTCSAATGGSVRIVVTYDIFDIVAGS